MNLMNEINHCPIPGETLRPHTPSSLQIDTFIGYAWLGVVVFVMKGVYPREFPYVALLSKFPEINVCTYVQYDDKPDAFLRLLIWKVRPHIQ